MPELPEVETIRQDLRKKVINKKIVDIEILHKKIVHGDNQAFLGILKNNKIKSIDRIGKLIIFELADTENFLFVHLKMTGQLIYKKGKVVVAGGHSDEWGKKPQITKELASFDKYVRVIITFADKAKLYFNDMRVFGYMKIDNKVAKDKIIKDFGIEPFTENFTLNNFANIFKNKRISLKEILLDQKLIAGIGNIYADEICFKAGVSPSRSASSLTREEINKLYIAIKYIFKKAIESRGTTFNNYVDSDGNRGNFTKYLQVYGRGGQDCKKCRKTLVKIRLVGRGTVFCKKCQK
ncbi:MAG: bifunctional DNA-formamidopyrimidine glycosylase/DNA-(apurinic or apyrimidinic site) lyase [bacterium]|nr:bifunctional DNA-formamidopyrimidine glycosylase/DNA-(apurinic or apyrimidinic site) lyase [bacterium]